MAEPGTPASLPPMKPPSLAALPPDNPVRLVRNRLPRRGSEGGLVPAE